MIFTIIKHFFTCDYCYNNIKWFLSNPLKNKIYWRFNSQHFYKNKYKQHFNDIRNMKDFTNKMLTKHN